MNAFAFRISNRTILRREIERQIETLIAALDDMDGDADREDDGTTEPSLGWTRTEATGTTDDREDDDGERGEPSLGSMDDRIDQRAWCGPEGHSVDLENDYADAR